MLHMQGLAHSMLLTITLDYIHPADRVGCHAWLWSSKVCLTLSGACCHHRPAWLCACRLQGLVMTGSHPLGSTVQLAGRCRPAFTQPCRPGHLQAPVQQARATSHKPAAGPSVLPRCSGLAQHCGGHCGGLSKGPAPVTLHAAAAVLLTLHCLQGPPKIRVSSLNPVANRLHDRSAALAHDHPPPHQAAAA